MAVLSLSNAHLAYGHVALLDSAAFALEAGERIGLIGRNGAGKSSLLKILAGLEKADDGTLQLQQGLRIAYVAQEPVLESAATVFEATVTAVADVVSLIDQYTHGQGDLDALQGRIEAQDGWNWEQRVEETLAARFPAARIVRIDRDTARRLYPVKLARVIDAIAGAIDRPPAGVRVIEAPEMRRRA